MNPNATAATNRLCNPTSSDKFLAPFPPGPTSQPETAASAYELTEADVFWSTPYQNTSSSSSPPDPRRNVAGRPHASGILAALPPTELDPTRPLFFNHKASLPSSSSSSSSSSRMIPKKAQHQHVDGHQSAPVNVPAMTEAMRRRRRKGIQFDDDDDDRDDGDGEMLLPPHEVVATRRRVACSVLEGVGRTLKGRDLRQVRNAVWRKTGFLD